jgi:hypothetical protein
MLKADESHTTTLFYAEGAVRLHDWEGSSATTFDIGLVFCAFAAAMTRAIGYRRPRWPTCRASWNDRACSHLHPSTSSLYVVWTFAHDSGKKRADCYSDGWFPGSRIGLRPSGKVA